MAHGWLFWVSTLARRSLLQISEVGGGSARIAFEHRACGSTLFRSSRPLDCMVLRVSHALCYEPRAVCCEILRDGDE